MYLVSPEFSLRKIHEITDESGIGAAVLRAMKLSPNGTVRVEEVDTRAGVKPQEQWRHLCGE